VDASSQEIVEMMVVMRFDSGEEEIAGVVQRVEELGLSPHVSRGAERIVIGVVGRTFPELASMLEVLPGVEEIVPISKPYKLSGRELHPHDSVVEVAGLRIGGGESIIMAGPCSVESEEQVVSTAREVRRCGAHILRGGAFKPRTSPYQFRGLGEEGLKMLDAARKETGLPVITEVLTPQDVDVVARYSDILQIGARNMQNFILLEEAGRSGKPVLLKRGFSGTIQEWLLASEYILATGNRQVMLCERGIRTFETETRNTMDISAIPLIKRVSHLPIIGDPSHGTGKWYLVEPMALATVAAGADGLLIEVHPNPDHALSDGPQSLTFQNFERLMQRVDAVADVVGKPLFQRRAAVGV
jgi:3-deoxy-7-phosphoheptulonate synthase